MKNSLGSHPLPGVEPATPENDDHGCADLHITGVRRRGLGDNKIALDFFMYNPPFKSGMRIMCGMCHTDMTGHQHCPRCWR